MRFHDDINCFREIDGSYRPMKSTYVRFFVDFKATKQNIYIFKSIWARQILTRIINTSVRFGNLLISMCCWCIISHHHQDSAYAKNIFGKFNIRSDFVGYGIQLASPILERPQPPVQLTNGKILLNNLRLRNFVCFRPNHSLSISFALLDWI